jgi:Tfp pilus assembly protein PilN
MVVLLVPGGPELLVLVLMAVLVVALYVALGIVLVRIGLVFIDYPESTETRQRIALLEHEITELEARIEELESE